MSSSQTFPSLVATAAGTWQKADIYNLRPNSPEIMVIREVDPNTDNCSSTADISPPPYSLKSKEYFTSEELHSDGEPLTLARFLFQYGFCKWLINIYNTPKFSFSRSLLSFLACRDLRLMHPTQTNTAMGVGKNRRRKGIPHQSFARNRTKMGTSVSTRILCSLRLRVLRRPRYQIRHITFRMMMTR